MNASVASSIASSASRATTYFGRESPGAVVTHRARRVDQDRDGGAEPFLDFGLIRRGGLTIAGIGRPVLATIGLAPKRQ